MAVEDKRLRSCALLSNAGLDVVYAFEWCPCIFESAFAIETLHTTKRGAFRAMTEAANSRWHEQRTRMLRGGYSKPRFDALAYEAWRIRPIEVSNVCLTP